MTEDRTFAAKLPPVSPLAKVAVADEVAALIDAVVVRDANSTMSLAFARAQDVICCAQAPPSPSSSLNFLTMFAVVELIEQKMYCTP